MRMRCLRGLWLAALLGVSSLAAAGKEALLADAVQRGDRQAVPTLLKTHADVNAPQSDGATALHWAAYLDDADTTALLIKAGARVDTPNHYGETPLMLAARTGNAEAATALLRAGAAIDAKETWNGQTALMWAAAAGHAAVVQALIDHRADIHARSNSGATALLFAT